MRVVLVDDDSGRSAILEQALTDHGYQVVARIEGSRDLNEAVARHAPDVVICDMASPDRDTLESMRQVSRDNPRPIVMFAEKSDQNTISQAISAGVSAYVVDGVEPRRLNSIMDVAIARFREYQALRKELHDTRTKLADRKDVDMAKGLLMKHKGMEEEQAYAALRKMAMDSNKSIGEVSRNLITAAQLLG